MTVHDLRRLGAPRFSRRTFLKTLAAIGVVGSGVSLAGCGGASGRVVEMNDQMAFVPANLKVNVGETVTWTNKSRAMVHTATADPTLVRDPGNVKLPPGVAPWHSGNIAPGQSWSHTFEIPGEYRYVCVPHEVVGMVGAITVDARGAGGSGGNSASTGGRFVARGATKSMTFRLTTNETMTTASAIEIVFRCIGRRIVPPNPT
mgnify:CR=1 FL=1